MRLPTADIQNNQDGSVLLGALAALFVAGLVSFAVNSSYVGFVGNSRTAQLRARMAAQETIVRMIAHQPTTYQCTGAGSIDYSNCSIVTAAFDKVSFQAISGAVCSTAGIPCGIRLSIPNSHLSADGTFRAILTYDGTETKLSPIDIQVRVPAEIAQRDQTDCSSMDPTRPAFVGFDTNTGRALCRGFTNAPCPQGQFISDIDFRKMSVTCRNLQNPNNDKFIECPSGQMISNVQWSGNNDVQHGCVELAIPEFNANLQVSTSTTTTTPVATPTPSSTPEPGRWIVVEHHQAQAFSGSSVIQSCFAKYGTTGTVPSPMGYNYYSVPRNGPCAVINEACWYSGRSTMGTAGYNGPPVYMLCRP